MAKLLNMLFFLLIADYTGFKAAFKYTKRNMNPPARLYN